MYQICIRVYFVPVCNAASSFNQDVSPSYKAIEDFQGGIGRERLI